MSSEGELSDRVKKAFAKLYVLRDSYTGISEAERSDKNLLWFQGAEAVLREALEVLQTALLAQEEEISTMKKREGKDWTDVERLIRKLENSTLSQSVYS